MLFARKHPGPLQDLRFQIQCMLHTARGMPQVLQEFRFALRIEQAALPGEAGGEDKQRH